MVGILSGESGNQERNDGELMPSRWTAARWLTRGRGAGGKEAVLPLTGDGDPQRTDAAREKGGV
jgi:hypothetical protein